MQNFQTIAARKTCRNFEKNKYNASFFSKNSNRKNSPPETRATFASLFRKQANQICKKKLAKNFIKN